MNLNKYLEGKEVFEFNTVKTSEIPFTGNFLKYCEENICGQYNLSWTCPPAVSYIKEQEKIKCGFTDAMVFSCKYDVKDFNDIEQMDVARNKTMDILRETVKEIKRNNIDCLAYGCSSCKICGVCSYPHQPCRFPDDAIVPLEACGINVFELTKKANINYYNGEKTVTFFCVIVFNGGNN